MNRGIFQVTCFPRHFHFFDSHHGGTTPAGAPETSYAPAGVVPQKQFCLIC